MGPVGYADSFGGFNQRMQDCYVEYAKHDVGLIVTGICSVDMQIEEFSGYCCSVSDNLPDCIHSQHPHHE